ncbi:MAG TPA: Hsp20/alpha crystallin family protein, partial [Anaerolineae bacterium]|nr:Hsp20/alpha crystallin family protein [Anaerolineae bacterium]
MALKSLVPWRRGNRLPAQRGVFEPFTEMERWFDDFFNSGFELRPFGESMRGFNPTVDVSESDEAYTISAELAGLGKKDVVDSPEK